MDVVRTGESYSWLEPHIHTKYSRYMYGYYSREAEESV
jgi:hypothetical protein